MPLVIANRSQPPRGYDPPSILARWLLLSGIALAAGCSGETRELPAAPRATDATVSAAVTATVRSQLMHGQFQLAVAAGPVPQITDVQAEDLARAWRLDFGPWVEPTLESQRAASIDLASLVVCGRTLYVQSYFDLPDAALMSNPVSAAVVRGRGPWWLVSLCGGAQDVQILLAVSAYATDLGLQQGHLVVPPIGGTWFVSLGVPRGAGSFVPLPEDVAVAVAQLTGRHVSAVPALIAPAVALPQLAQWRVTLDAPASVRRTDGSTATTTELYVGQGTVAGTLRFRMPIAAALQPASLVSGYDAAIQIGQPARPASWQEITFRRGNDVASTFDDVTADPSSNPAQP